MEQLKELLERLKEKLEYTRNLIGEYDHAMDFASHCTMQGLAEGIEFAIEEIEELMNSRVQGSGVREQGKSKNQGKDNSKGRGIGKGESASKKKAQTKARPQLHGKRLTKGKRKEKVRIGVKGKGRR